MDQSVPTVALRVNPESGDVFHDVLSPDRHLEAVGWGEDSGFRAGPLGKAQYMLAANGSIVELASADGRFRHEVFVPWGKLEELLLASSLFPVVRLVSRVVVLERRPMVDDQYYEDPARKWVTQGSL